MKRKRNQALVFLGLLVLTLLYLFGHIFPMLQALKEDKHDVCPQGPRLNQAEATGWRDG